MLEILHDSQFSKILASELRNKHKPTLHKKPQILILLCITVFSSKFKDENKGDLGNSSKLWSVFVLLQHINYCKKLCSLQELESIFLTESTRHDETWLHPSHKDAAISPTNSSVTPLSSNAEKGGSFVR
jgi:hypothetical protein